MVFEPSVITTATVNVVAPSGENPGTVSITTTQGQGLQFSFTDYGNLRAQVADAVSFIDTNAMLTLTLGWLLARSATASAAINNKSQIEGKTITFDLSKAPNSIFKVVG